ncbi:hypothetical protein GCM10025789_07120 [Tessaracoccus lubricantis]|uniref:DUF2017 domain-containing protein n=1 Tax=Tessaracoccus lubricantis TaxID=545543 RepID=A0ABP9F3E3_9ACTN
MGILDKLFGRSAADDDAPVKHSAFDPHSVRPQLDDLIGALGELADAMETDDAPISNPGWRGRLRDLRNARGELRLLSRKESFTKDDLYEVLTTVRPLYRGEPPKDFAHLAHLNERVVAGIEAVHQAAN